MNLVRQLRHFTAVKVTPTPTLKPSVAVGLSGLPQTLLPKHTLTKAPALQIITTQTCYPLDFSEFAQFDDLKNEYWKTKNLQSFIHSFSTQKPIGLLEIKCNVFNLESREDILARCLKYEASYLAQGTESTKTLGQVRGSGRKHAPGKGRGKARVGSIRSPQFVGGYNVHGPHPHNKTIDIQKKVYNLGLKTALSVKFKQNQILLVDKFILKDYLKQELKTVLLNFNLGTKKIYFIHGFDESRFQSVVDQFTKKIRKRGQSSGEKELLITHARHVSVKTLLEHDVLVIDKEGLEILEDMYSNE